jgi:hypothetical protein
MITLAVSGTRILLTLEPLEYQGTQVSASGLA